LYTSAWRPLALSTWRPLMKWLMMVSSSVM
jgi:hypothetical protein